MTTIESKLRALWVEHRAGPFEDIPRSSVMHVLRTAANLGDSEGYARGWDEAIEACCQATVKWMGTGDIRDALRDLKHNRALKEPTDG